MTFAFQPNSWKAARVFFREEILAIEQEQFHGRIPMRCHPAGDFQHESAITGAEFQNAGGWSGHLFPNRLADPAGIAHPPIHTAQIAAGTDGRGMIRRQFIQEFRFEQAFHAPW